MPGPVAEPAGVDQARIHALGMQLLRDAHSGVTGRNADHASHGWALGLSISMVCAVSMRWDAALAAQAPFGALSGSRGPVASVIRVQTAGTST